MSGRLEGGKDGLSRSLPRKGATPSQRPPPATSGTSERSRVATSSGHQQRGHALAVLLLDGRAAVLQQPLHNAETALSCSKQGTAHAIQTNDDGKAGAVQLTAQHDISGGEERYFQVIRGKTAELFAAAAEVGGVIAGAESAKVEALRAYGDALGIAFQLVDDVLDYGGSSKAMGKNVGDDFREGKATLPVLLAHADGDAEERAFWVRVIEDHEQADGDLETALGYFAKHDALGRTKARAEEFAAIAIASLDAFADSPVKAALADVCDFVVSRAR